MARKLILIFVFLVCALIAIRIVKGGRRDGLPGPLDRAFVNGGSIVMDLSAGDYRIVPTADDHVTVDFRARYSRDVSRTHVYFDPARTPAVLEISGRSNNMHVEIGVPAKTSVEVNLTAGRLRLAGVEGSKSVSCHACELVLDIGAKEQYGPVDASVITGNLQASPWSVHTGGLLRSFSIRGPGSYSLRAHADAGNVVITSR